MAICFLPAAVNSLLAVGGILLTGKIIGILENMFKSDTKPTGWYLKNNDLTKLESIKKDSKTVVIGPQNNIYDHIKKEIQEVNIIAIAMSLDICKEFKITQTADKILDLNNTLNLYSGYVSNYILPSTGNSFNDKLIQAIKNAVINKLQDKIQDKILPESLEKFKDSYREAIYVVQNVLFVAAIALAATFPFCFTPEQRDELKDWNAEELVNSITNIFLA